ncbi:hypothetical protein, partial [Bacteroides pyogenes]|uniref:hypothetical protein n=1 Tax=Bacteroides pyogenes TaxID=310300 RepID=UPI003F9F039C
SLITKFISTYNSSNSRYIISYSMEYRAVFESLHRNPKKAQELPANCRRGCFLIYLPGIL